MENIISLLVSIVIGGFIGWITNLIAIKALFHPYKSYKILGFEYQGLLPKRKPELANNLGKMVDKQLINIPELIDKVKPEDVNPFIDKLVDEHKEDIRDAISDYIRHYKISINAFGHILEFELGHVLKSNNTLVNTVTETVVKLLKEKGKQAVPTVLSKAGKEIEEHIDVHDIVEKKVNDMDLDKLEKMVNDIADREMKMIEYLGGVLGCIVGAIQWVILYFIR